MRRAYGWLHVQVDLTVICKSAAADAQGVAVRLEPTRICDDAPV